MLLAPLSPCYTSPSRRSLAKPCRDRCCIHHHAVVLLDLHQPLLPPCWIKKEETSSPTVRVLNTEVPCVRYLIGRIVKTYDYINRVVITLLLNGLRGYVDNTLPSRCYAITMILRVRRKKIYYDPQQWDLSVDVICTSRTQVSCGRYKSYCRY